jgi:4-aminobutyrate aminotransferase
MSHQIDTEIDQIDLLSPVWTHVTTMQPVRGRGIYLWNAEGERFTDFTSGIGVVNTGHCHPHVVEAIQNQAESLLFAQMNVVIGQPTIRLAGLLNDITPPSIDRFFFSNSGAEATEGAVKLARNATGRKNIIVFQGSFHGRTHLAMAMTTSKYIYRHGYQPLPGGIFVTPFPAAYQFGWDEKTTVDFCLKQLDLLFHSQTAPDETAAIIIEPVLGEGGYVPAPPYFMQKLREICTKHGIMFVADEVQSGFGRTGKQWCFEYADIEPDIIVMAKGLGSGLPISCIASTQEIMEKWRPGTHGGTYGGGSAIASAAACATIEVMQSENLAQNAFERGEQLRTALRKMQQKYPVIGDVRGLGLMTATEFSDVDGKPDAATTAAVQKACLKRNLLLLSCGSYGNIIRWIPPLVVDFSQIEDAVEIFEAALVEVCG